MFIGIYDTQLTKRVKDIDTPSTNEYLEYISFYI